MNVVQANVPVNEKIKTMFIQLQIFKHNMPIH